MQITDWNKIPSIVDNYPDLLGYFKTPSQACTTRACSQWLKNDKKKRIYYVDQNEAQICFGLNVNSVLILN